MTRPAESSDPCLWEVVEEHRDEAEFLLETRRAALLSPLYALDELEGAIEPRLLAHVDGLVVGGAAVAERLLLPCIQEEGASSALATAAGLALLSAASPASSLQVVLEVCSEADDARREGLCDALRLSLQPALPALLPVALRTVGSDAARAVLLHGLAAHRVDPGAALGEALESNEPRVRAAALAVVAAAVRADCLPAVHAALESASGEVRDVAIEAGLVLGSPYAWDACTSFGAKPDPRDSRKLLLGALLGGAGAVRKHLDEPSVRCDVVWALGFGGRIEDAAALLELLRDADPRVAKLAGEAFGAITGYACEEREVQEQESEAEPEPEDGAENEVEAETDAQDSDDAEAAAALPPLAEDDLDADLAPGPVDELPVVDPAAAEAWWQANRERFDGARRWLMGQPHGIDALRDALAHGPLRRRHALATALRIASGGKHGVSAWAFASRQRRELSALAALRAADLPNRF